MGKKRTPAATTGGATQNCSVGHNTYNISSNNNSRADGDDSPWDADEHQRFLGALEQFGGGQCATAQNTWNAIARGVGTRDAAQVAQHARIYFSQLQQLNAQKRHERELMQSVDQRWTPEEDAAFEDMLAAYSTSSVCYPWDTMAARLPGKAPMDLKERFQKLCYDVSRIENGEHVTMRLGPHLPRCPGFTPTAKTAANMNNSVGVHVMDSAMSPCLHDCVVTLTLQEEQILMSAMAEVNVPPQAPTDLLEGIASAVATFTSSNGRVPPQRTHPLFSKEQALAVLNGLLANRKTDPQTLLETLVLQLRLHPHALDVSTGVTFGVSPFATDSTTYEAESVADPNLHLLATTGLTFGAMLPSPYGSELALSFGAENLDCAVTTPRFMHSLGLGLPSPHPTSTSVASAAASTSAPSSSLVTSPSTASDHRM